MGSTSRMINHLPTLLPFRLNTLASSTVLQPPSWSSSRRPKRETNWNESPSARGSIRSVAIWLLAACLPMWQIELPFDLPIPTGGRSHFHCLLTDRASQCPPLYFLRRIRCIINTIINGSLPLPLASDRARLIISLSHCLPNYSSWNNLIDTAPSARFALEMHFHFTAIYRTKLCKRTWHFLLFLILCPITNPLLSFSFPLRMPSTWRSVGSYWRTYTFKVTSLTLLMSYWGEFFDTIG